LAVIMVVVAGKPLKTLNRFFLLIKFMN
jgi:hypothetical protein